MQIIHFFKHEMVLSKQTLFVIVTLSGIANALLLVVVNTAAEALAGQGDLGRPFILYILLLVLFLYTQYRILMQSAKAVEVALLAMKQRVTDKIQQANLLFIENHLNLGFFTTLTQDTATIAQAALRIISAVQSLLVIVFSAIYLFFISPLSFFLLALFLIALIPVFTLNSHAAKNTLQQSHDTQTTITNKLAELLQGFKELRLDPAASDAFFARLHDLTHTSAKLKTAANLRISYDIVFSTLARYLLLLLVVFIVPLLVIESADTTHHVVAAVLFIVAPITLLTNALPTLMRTEASIANLYALETKLATADQDKAEQHQAASSQFKQIALQGVQFHYNEADTQPLIFGPFELTLKQHQVMFITGGNGSGKSTLLKLLAGLYTASAGTLIWDGQPVTSNRLADFRGLFSGVFADAYLFDELYNICEHDPNKLAEIVDVWLDSMELSDQVNFDETRFIQSQLSIGQQKRLALIVSILKKRPILLLDEFTADQEPHFRDYVYRQVIPKLQSAGYTLVLVTHDEAYFELADVMIRLQDRKVIP